MSERKVPGQVWIDYTNWQGKRSLRRIIPGQIYTSSNEWHPEEQPLMDALDLDKNATRTFALNGVRGWYAEKPEEA